MHHRKIVESYHTMKNKEKLMNVVEGLLIRNYYQNGRVQSLEDNRGRGCEEIRKIFIAESLPSAQLVNDMESMFKHW